MEQKGRNLEMTLEEKRLEKLETLLEELKKQSKTNTAKQEQANALEWLIKDKYLQLDLQKHHS